MVITMRSSESISIGTVCFINSVGNMAPADKDALSTSYGCMIALESIDAFAWGKFLMFGTITNPAWDWTAGDKLFLGDNGALSTSVVGGTNDVSQILGIARSATTILFMPSLAQAEIN
jgi:hypothetical protein